MLNILRQWLFRGREQTPRPSGLVVWRDPEEMDDLLEQIVQQAASSLNDAEDTHNP